jgi:hypothetical protein
MMLRIILALLVFTVPAYAHQPIFSNGIVVQPDPYGGKTDPVHGNGCCGGSDCDVLKVEPGMLEGEGDDLRLRMTLEQAKKINPYRTKPVDTIIRHGRVQDSWDGNYHVCIRSHDPTVPFSGEPDIEKGAVYCFWAPPNT